MQQCALKVWSYQPIRIDLSKQSAQIYSKVDSLGQPGFLTLLRPIKKLLVKLLSKVNIAFYWFRCNYPSITYLRQTYLTIFKLADRMSSMRTNGASKNRLWNDTNGVVCILMVLILVYILNYYLWCTHFWCTYF